MMAMQAGRQCIDKNEFTLIARSHLMQGRPECADRTHFFASDADSHGIGTVDGIDISIPGRDPPLVLAPFLGADWHRQQQR